MATYVEILGVLAFGGRRAVTLEELDVGLGMAVEIAEMEGPDVERS